MQRFHSALRGISGTMVFQVLLTDPDRQRFCRDTLVELRNAAHAQTGQPRKFLQAGKAFEHIAAGTAPSVAVAESQKREIMPPFCAEIMPGIRQLLSSEARIVAMLRVTETVG